MNEETQGIKMLRRDLVVIKAMVDDMEDYLNSDVLFWPLQEAGYPRLTLGGYLMREYRLLALRDLLNKAEGNQLSAIVDSFLQIAAGGVVRLEQKAGQELGARIRQWQQRVEEFKVGVDVSAAYYSTDAQIRVMIAVLIQKFQSPPYRLDPLLLDQVAAEDKRLQKLWHAGEFIWPAEWLPAYPEHLYWWLYGTPKKPG